MSESLNSEELFRRFLAPVYPPDAMADLGRARTTDANPAGNRHILAQLDEVAEVFARLAPAALEAPELTLDFSDASVHRLSTRITRARRDAWLEPSGAEGEPPLLVKMVTHGAIYLGACVVKNHAGVWQVRRPLWESLVRLESRAGVADLAPLMWWLKALSDDEIDHGRLADRYRAHVELPTLDASSLPVIAAGDRKLPRLARVSYASLHQHLRAHLPELRGVGEDFPSPERFEELGFQSLDLVLLGGGRMLLMHGRGNKGVHLFWLDVNGFVQSAFYPADPFPAHVVQIDGDKLRVIVPIQGATTVHEMLWWGT
jgi:hypothetical protein